MEEKDRKLITLKVPPTILANEELSLVQKVIHSFTYSYSFKLGFNSLTNKDLAEILRLDVQNIGRQRKELVEKGFERKETGGKYFITDKHKETEPSDKRELKIPKQIYQMKMVVGAKLLWGEYNSHTRNGRGCFAGRDTLAERLGCNEDSITNWFNILNKAELIEETELRSGHGTKQRVVKTKWIDVEEEGDAVVKKEKQDNTTKKDKAIVTTKQTLEKQQVKKEAPLKKKTVELEKPVEEKDYWGMSMHNIMALTKQEGVKKGQISMAVKQILAYIMEEGEDVVVVLKYILKHLDQGLKGVEWKEELREQLKAVVAKFGGINN